MTINATRAEVRRLIDEEEAQIVDVLPHPEYSEAHIPGAINIPLKQLTSESAALLDSTKPVVVYCHDGL